MWAKKAGRETVAYERLVKEFAVALEKEFLRQYKAFLSLLNSRDAFERLYAYAVKHFPEVYDTNDEKKVEKAKAGFFNIPPDKDWDSAALKEIGKFYEGWAEKVKPEKMEDIITYYSMKAGELGGDKALNDLGIKLAFNLKNPGMIAEIANRGEKITGDISENTLNNFRDTFYRMYMEEGASPYDLKEKIKYMFEETYANRAMTISRTESGIAHTMVQNEAYAKNGVKKKQWISVIDEFTRGNRTTDKANHIEMNGEEVNFDEPFSNGLDFPLQASAPPEEIINCRCDFIATEFDENFCSGDNADNSDCVVPWTGGAAGGVEGDEEAVTYYEDF